MKKLVLLIFILLLYLSARADYHYASHDGSNEYPFTSWETGAHLIQDAVDATAPHDTVYVDSGGWFEAVAVEDYDSVAIIGMGIDSTFWYSDSLQTPVLTIDYGCSVENITFEHLNDWIAVRARAYAGVRVNNCRFLRSRAGVGAAGGPSEITNCIFDSCKTSISLPIWIGNFFISNNLITNTLENWAIYLQVDTAVVQNNIIVNSPESYVDCVAGAPDYAIIRNNVAIYGRSGFGGDFKINNTAMNHDRDTGSHGLGANEGDTLINNSSSGCRWGITVLADNCVINYNNLWDNYGDFGNSGHPIDSVGNIYRNPMFVSGYDVHLQAFSPLIDAGDPGILDIDGSRSDIGAYGGPYGCSYTYLDLAPQIPDSITAEVEEDLVRLNWRFNTEADFNRYQIFRDTVSGFTPSEFNMIAEPDTSYYEDQDIDPGTAYYYRLTSIDNQGNVSDYSDEVGFIPTDISPSTGDRLPGYMVIESAYPNPFNSNVTIVYSASNLGPQPPEIKLQIFDIQGRVVRTLVDDRMPVGTYRAVWDGNDDHGWPVSSGVYIARVYQWGMDGDFPVKITLIK